MIVIVGCPKSATMYIAELLKRMGLDFKHEEYAEDGMADWRLAVENPRPWGGYSGHEKLDFLREANILHQVREPLSTMSSMQKIAGWEYIFSYINVFDYANHVPVRMPDSITKRCMLCWYHWNRKAESIAKWTYRIEDLEKIWGKFCRMINHPELIRKKEILQTVPKNINTAKPYKPLEWHDLFEEDEKLARKIVALAERYGYI